MTRTSQPQQNNQGHKRKEKPVEAWMLELEKAQDEENNGSQSLDLSAIEQIADGVEQMVFSWGLQKQERGQEYEKLSKAFSKDDNNTSHVLLPWSLNNKTEGELGLGLGKSPKQTGNTCFLENPKLQPCHSVLKCSKGETRHDCENELKEDSSCLATTPEQESICESIELEFANDDCNNIIMCNPKCSEGLRKGNIIAKESEFPSSLWSPRRQESILKDQYQPSNDSPLLLSQSTLCQSIESPSLRQSNEVIINNQHGGSSTDLPLSSPIQKNEPQDNSVAPILSYSSASPCCSGDMDLVEVGGHTIKVTVLRGGNDVLEDKFQALVNINACALGTKEDHQLKPSPSSDVEDLQIALLECAMEYEIKTIEAKMKMQELKLKGQQSVAIIKSEPPCPYKAIEPIPTTSCEKPIDNQRLQQLKKQMMKLQHEKENLNNQLHAFRDKERQFERQKRSLEDALLRVNCLQREVVKKEQEVVEWQLKEKETKAQLQEIGEKLKKERHAQVQLPIEPKKLLTLLPALCEWLRSLKKAGLAKAAERRQFQDKEDGDSAVHPHLMENYITQPAAVHSKEKGMPVALPAHLSLLGQLSEELANQANPALNVHQVDMVICCLTKEIQALQKELTKLARSRKFAM